MKIHLIRHDALVFLQSLRHHLEQPSSPFLLWTLWLTHVENELSADLRRTFVCKLLGTYFLLPAENGLDACTQEIQGFVGMDGGAKRPNLRSRVLRNPSKLLYMK